MRLTSAHNEAVNPDQPAGGDEPEASAASGDAHDTIGTHKLRQLSFLRRIPPPVRKPLVSIMGATLIVTGLLLVVLPGPFTLPLIIAGVALLSTEFVWASRVFAVSHHHTRRLLAKTRNPWVMAGLILLGLALAATGYSVFVAPRLS